MNEVQQEKEQTQAEILLFKLQFMGVMMMAGRQEVVDELYVDAQKICKEMMKQGLETKPSPPHGEGAIEPYRRGKDMQLLTIKNARKLLEKGKT